MNRFQKVKIASILGIIGNLFLFVIKLIAGMVFHSSAMTADAFNSGGDIISSIMTFIGNKIASIPSDEDHNMGHGKAEYIYAMLVSIIIIITGYIVIKNSITSFVFKRIIDFSYLLIVICIINIILKLSLYFYTNNIAREENNLLIKANSKDHLYDALIAFLNLLSCILAYFNIYLVDSIVGFIIGIWILVSAVKIYKESYDVLMDKSISDDLKTEVIKIIDTHKEIQKINHFNSTPVGYKFQISLTIFVDGNLSTFESHKIADDLEKEIIKKIDEIYLVIIHVNPI